MAMKSRPDGYGTVAVALHWLSAILIVAVLVTGFRAAGAALPAAKAALLQVHVPLAILVLLLTLARVVWWWRIDRKPRPLPGLPGWQMRVARAVHLAFYVVLFGMAASGIGMMVLSGAGPAVFGRDASTLPDFAAFAPRRPHGVGARLLIALLVVHVGAVLHHQFIRRDGLLRRMWFGR